MQLARVIGHATSTIKHSSMAGWRLVLVQPLGATNAVKTYLCPGCGLDIAPGIAHVVAWRADGLMGEADDIAARRHWHSHCWKIKQ